MKSLDKRIEEMEQSMQPSECDRVDDIDFIIPDAPFHQYGIEFKNFSECLRYCDANGIKYRKERGPFGMDSYIFPEDH